MTKAIADALLAVDARRTTRGTWPLPQSWTER